MLQLAQEWPLSGGGYTGITSALRTLQQPTERLLHPAHLPALHWVVVWRAMVHLLVHDRLVGPGPCLWAGAQLSLCVRLGDDSSEDDHHFTRNWPWSLPPTGPLCVLPQAHRLVNRLLQRLAHSGPPRQLLDYQQSEYNSLSSLVVLSQPWHWLDRWTCLSQWMASLSRTCLHACPFTKLYSSLGKIWSNCDRWDDGSCLRYLLTCFSTAGILLLAQVVYSLFRFSLHSRAK